MITPETRARVLSAISELGTGGSTNMAEGLELAEMHVAQAPHDHPVRRIVMISDGQANVGLSSPQALGELAQRSLSLGAQVTSLGVGLDYDERTLDAIAERTSGRLFHVGDPREMTATLEHEIDLLAATVADQASIEIVPAPGVVLVSVEGARIESGANGAVRIPLGTLYAGQHREALVRMRLTESASGAQRALASVRLQFHDPAENDVERVQEVLARASTSDDPVAVASHANAKTHAMMAMVEAAKTEIQAAQDVGSGNFMQAQTQLAAPRRACWTRRRRRRTTTRGRSSPWRRRRSPWRGPMPPRPRRRRRRSCAGRAGDEQRGHEGRGVLTGCLSSSCARASTARGASPRAPSTPSGARRAEPGARVAVEVLVERDEVRKCGSLLARARSRRRGALPVRAARKSS
jgi:Ca-activated chloride channel family protein